MTESMRTALAGVEPVDPSHYFARLGFEAGPTYGLVDAQLSPDTAPPELDEARVVVAERVDDEDYGTKPVLTVMFEEVDGVEVEASEAKEEEAETDQAHLEILVGRADTEFGEVPNSVVQTPRDAAAIIKKVMEKRRLGRVTTTPEDVFGLPAERYRNAANFLLEAGFHKVYTPSDSETTDGAQGDVYELRMPVRPPKRPGSEHPAELPTAA